MGGDQHAMVEMERVAYVCKTGGQPILRDISLRVERGEWVCIVGRNGSGKSTLVRLLNGLLTASSGRISVGGILLEPDTVGPIRRKIGYVFQSPDNQFVGLTVLDELVFGLENLGLDRSVMRERLNRYAGQLQVAHLLDRHPGQLSGGQKQRVAVASILAMEPDIVVLDEATSMLDEKSKSEMLDMFREMKASGRYTIISVTHDTEEMLAADRMLALVYGTIAAEGTPQRLLAQEEPMSACGIQPPFLLRLGRSLGGSIGEDALFDEERLVKALWESYSSK